MLAKLIGLYSKLLILIMALLMMLLLITVALQIAGRYIPFVPRFLWTDEVASYTLVWVVFLGAIIGVRTGKHFYVDFLPQNLPASVDKALKVLYYLLLYAISLIFVTYGFRFFMGGCSQQSQIIGFNLGLVYVTLPFAGFSWLIFLSENLYHDLISGRGKGE